MVVMFYHKPWMNVVAACRVSLWVSDLLSSLQFAISNQILDQRGLIKETRLINWAVFASHLNLLVTSGSSCVNLLRLMSPQGSWSIWPCSVSGCGGGSGPSGLWRWRILTMTETVRAAAAVGPLRDCWTLTSSPGLTLWTTATAAVTQPDTVPLWTPTSRSSTQTWTRALKMTVTLKRSWYQTWRFDDNNWHIWRTCSSSSCFQTQHVAASQHPDWVFICRGYKLGFLILNKVYGLSPPVPLEVSTFFLALFVSDTEVVIKVPKLIVWSCKKNKKKNTAKKQQRCRWDRWHFTCYEMMQLITTLPYVITHKSIPTDHVVLKEQLLFLIHDAE